MTAFDGDNGDGGWDEVLYDETETVALSGPHLAELLAASGETPAAAWDLDVSVETTVVIPGSRVKTVPPPPRSSGSLHAVAYSVAQPIVERPTMTTFATGATPTVAPRRSLARDATAFSLAALGLLIGLTAATALTAETTTPVPSRAVATEARRVLASDATPLVGATRQKAGPITKRPRGMSIGAARNSAASAKTASTRTPDAGEDPQLAEDQRLVMAAQLERSL